MKEVLGTVVDMDISHMNAAVKLTNKDYLVEVKVGTIYDVGDDITIYDVQNEQLPWFLQGTEYMDESPISEAEVLRDDFSRLI